MIFIKTLIELFDECQIENIVSGLKYEPEKIIFVGFKETMKRSKIDALEKLFSNKNIKVDFEYEVVSRYDYQGIIDRLNMIVDKNNECCFDLTGGKELVLVAMGEVAARRNIPMIQVNIKTGDVIPVKCIDSLPESTEPSLSVEECIILNGGSVIHNGTDYNWQFSEDFIKDIDIIWNISKEDSRAWNRQSSIFSALDKVGRLDDDLSTYVDRAKLLNQEIVTNERIINQLMENHLLNIFQVDGDIVRFKFKNNQVRECVTKAGNILELYLYSLMKYEISAFYDDIDVSVIIDWDGIIHEKNNLIKDTINEVDIIATTGLIPLFISCKNGEVHKEALYELNSVAERFGGEYSKKFLFTTYLSLDINSKMHILQRAKDMNIEIIEGIDKMDKEELISIIKSRVK